MKFLLLIVLLWIVSDDASAVPGSVMDYEDSSLNMENPELNVSSLPRSELPGSVMDYEDSSLNMENPELDVSSLPRIERSYKTTDGEKSQYRNVALQGRATQSTIYLDSVAHTGYLGMAINAIDGNQDSHYYHGSCTHTHKQLSPWWRVDLLKSYRISHITITNRRDCCEYRLDSAEILVGDSLANNGNNNLRCGVVGTIPAGGSQTFHCNNMVGRFVNVILLGKEEYLHLCEVEVFGADLLNDQTYS